MRTGGDHDHRKWTNQRLLDLCDDYNAYIERRIAEDEMHLIMDREGEGMSWEEARDLPWNGL